MSLVTTLDEDPYPPRFSGVLEGVRLAMAGLLCVDELKILHFLPSYEETARKQDDLPALVVDELAGDRVDFGSGGQEDVLRFGVPGGVGLESADGRGVAAADPWARLQTKANPAVALTLEQEVPRPRCRVWAREPPCPGAALSRRITDPGTSGKRYGDIRQGNQPQPPRGVIAFDDVWPLWPRTNM